MRNLLKSGSVILAAALALTTSFSNASVVRAAEIDTEYEDMEPGTEAETEASSEEEPEETDSETPSNEEIESQSIFDTKSVDLQYGDYYTFAEAQSQGYTYLSESDVSITSYKVSEGETQSELDDSLLTFFDEDGNQITPGEERGADSFSYKAIASAIGTATITFVNPNNITQILRYRITVTPAKLTLIYLTGQSNMEGWCPTDEDYIQANSIASEPGEVYSSYLVRNAYSKKVIGDANASLYLDVSADEFVPSSLLGTTSMTGSELTYPLNALTTDGAGKTGPDGAIAYKWNALTGDKVWTVNAAIGDTGIISWVPGGSNYEAAMDMYSYVNQVYDAEIASGHFTTGNRLMFYLQGEKDKFDDFDTYYEYLTELYSNFVEKLSLDALGFIMPRATTGNNEDDSDLIMTAPRLAQYFAAQISEMPKAAVVSDVNELWTTDVSVASYFTSAYPSGSLDYPMHTGSTLSALPTTVAEVHPNIHYMQVGHNENGLTAAVGMYQFLYGTDQGGETVSWRTDLNYVYSDVCSFTGDSFHVTGVSLNRKSSMYVLAVSSKSYFNRNLIYEPADDTIISYDKGKGLLTGLAEGSTNLNVYDCNHNLLGSLPVTVTPYVPVTGLTKIGDQWVYVVDDVPDYTYTGFATNSNGTWYVKDGIVDFSLTDVLNVSGHNYNGWYYVKNGALQTGNITVAKNKYGWWYIDADGKVDFTACTVAKNSNGWWYIKNGKVDFSYTGIARNANGDWYIEKGKVNFNATGVYQAKSTQHYPTSGSGNIVYNGWYYVKSGKVIYGTETVAKNSNGWWYIGTNGKVNFNYNGIAANANGKWYIQNGKVDFSFNGVARDKNGDWYAKGGKIQTTATSVVSVESTSYYGTTKNPETVEYSGWYYFVNGKLYQDDQITVAKNNNGWWFIGTDGKVDFDYTGLASNANGTWMVADGKVDFSYEGVAKLTNAVYAYELTEEGITPTEGLYYYIYKGKVTLDKTDVINLSGKKYYSGLRLRTLSDTVYYGKSTWYYIKDGILYGKGQTGVTVTIGANSYGYWYIEARDGSVDRSYTGIVVMEDGLWKVESGKATKL